MAGAGFESGQDRVKRMERNNRTQPDAKSTAAKTPRKRGAQAGFASNPTKGKSGGIFRKSNSPKNSTLGS